MSVNDVPVKYGEAVSMIATAAVDDYDVVILGTNPNEVTKATAATDRAIGVVRNGALAGRSVSVYGHTGDVYLCRTSAAITAGDRVGPVTDGEIVTITTGNATRLGIGVALKTGVNNDIIPVLWQPQVIFTHA